MRRSVRIGLWVVVVIAGVVGALAAYGATQPRDHEVSASITLDRAPGEVFAILDDARSYRCWRSGLDEVEVLAEDPRRWIEHGEDGAVTYEVVERDPAAGLLVVRIADEDLPYGGRWTYRVADQGGSTRLTITESGFIDGILLRGIAALVMDPSASIQQYQADLRAWTPCD